MRTSSAPWQRCKLKTLLIYLTESRQHTHKTPTHVNTQTDEECALGRARLFHTVFKCYFLRLSWHCHERAITSCESVLLWFVDRYRDYFTCRPDIVTISISWHFISWLFHVQETGKYIFSLRFWREFEIDARFIYKTYLDWSTAAPKSIQAVDVLLPRARACAHSLYISLSLSLSLSRHLTVCSCLYFVEFVCECVFAFFWEVRVCECLCVCVCMFARARVSYV